MHSSRLSPLTTLPSLNIQNPMNQTSQSKPNKTTVKLPTSLPCEDIFTNITTLLRIYKHNPSLTSCIHAKIIKLGLDTSTIITNSLLDNYAKCGQLEDAAKVFDDMPTRTVVSWTSMISGYCQKGLIDEAISLFWEMLEDMQPNEYTLAVILRASAQKGDGGLVRFLHCFTIKCGFIMDKFLQNSLVNAYAKCGMVEEAEKLLEIFTSSDVVAWTSVISGCVCSKMVERALILFFLMQEDGVLPNEVTILSILQACSAINDWRIFQWIHGLILKNEWRRNSLVVNSLVEMYSTNGYFEEGVKIFCNFCFLGDGFYLNDDTMAALLHGCGKEGFLKMGEVIHGYLIKHRFFPCTIVENSLINMYAENEMENATFQLFNTMRFKDIISWNAMIKCLVKNEQEIEALNMLSEIHTNGPRNTIFADFVTMLSSIQACSNLASLRMGQVIHGYTARTGLESDVFIQNSLIELYAKSGKLDFAKKIFEDIKEKDLGSWNSMIAAYGIHGNGILALNTFTELKRSKIHQPNNITFLNILSACAHAGLVKEGFEIFTIMSIDYGIEPSTEHFACIMDLFGRSGRLKEAQDFIDKMPFRPGPDVWRALLGACGLFGNVEIAERAAKELSGLEPNSDIWRVALSNVYARVGKWEDSAKLRGEMRGVEKVKKEGGWSAVEAGGGLVRFGVGDVKHAESKMIYKVVHCIHEQIREGGLTEAGTN
ncbi:hypothetical protein LguiB_006800 [Lonicera macranthoides]